MDQTDQGRACVLDSPVLVQHLKYELLNTTCET